MTRSIVIVGGGIVGTAAAYFSAREGLQVTLLEREQVGYGASGRNPGFVWLHCRNPGFALTVARAGRRLYPQLLEDLPVSFEFHDSGGLMYFNTPEQGTVFQQFVAARRRDGVQMELIDGAEVRGMVPPIRRDVLGASYSPEDARINTLSVVQALAAGARAEGADLREGVTVQGIAFSGDAVAGVDTDIGRIAADTVVVAAGAWSRPLLRDAGIDLPVGAERLQVVSTEPLPMRIEPVVYGPLAAKQYTLFRSLPAWNREWFTTPDESEQGMEMLQLLSQRSTGEVLLGCPMDYPAEIDQRPTLAGLGMIVRSISEDFPGLAGAPVSRMWAGCLPYTADTAPIIDELRPGLLVAAGHVFGNAAGPMTGRLISQLLLGREPEIDLSECRHDRALSTAPAGQPVRW